MSEEEQPVAVAAEGEVDASAEASAGDTTVSADLNATVCLSTDTACQEAEAER